jgi:hypothetical protein
MKPDEGRASKRNAEPFPQQTMRGADAERTEPQAPQPLNRIRTLEPERRRLLAAAPTRDENGAPLRRKATKRERKNRGGRHIEPLHVVDGNQHRLAAAGPEQLKRGERDRTLVWRRALDLL